MFKHLITGGLLLMISTVSAQFLSTKKELQNFQGFYNFHYSNHDGNIYLEVPVSKLDQEFLFVHSLRTGLGSNDIGLDRGQLGDEAIVKFVKSGNKLLLMQPNQKYRAITENNLERKSIQEAFATSVLFGFEIKETQGTTYIIDLTPFLMLDMHKVANTLKRNKEGTYKLDTSRNTVWMERTKSFPKNTEFEAMLTFSGNPTGRNLRSVAPDASSLSVIQHYSFVALPDAGYTPRVFDPRSGAISMSYLDYSTPIWEPIKKRFVLRHRLEKKNPDAEKSAAVEPIIYYLDPGTPEPIRSALLEGARWWNQAYEAIGYTDAFQVQMLPEGADPMDVRYNVIQWVHRSTRGWSYGGSVVDPRTGEIIKGHVSLGSLRIRQDFMIAQALMNKPFAERDDNYEVMLEMALARIRQLSAHEVGHTIGFAHNFAASSYGRESVMDYPHPTLTLKNNEVDFSNAYATGIGAWDTASVRYSYGSIPDGVDEVSYLRSIAGTTPKGGRLPFISDSDARAQGGAHATAHLWDNGADASQELEDLLALRKRAISNFSIDNIPTGQPYSVLEDVFVPLYFYHRYQTEAAVKKIGGMHYDYTVRNDSDNAAYAMVSKKAQEKAMRAVLKTLESSVLAIPEDKLQLFPPRAYGYGRSRESFKSDMGVAFDALGAPATAATMSLRLLLHPERANRMVQQNALDSKNLSLLQLQEELINQVFSKLKGSDYEKEVQQTIQYVTLQQLIQLMNSKKSIPQVKAITKKSIQDLKQQLIKDSSDFALYLHSEILRFEKFPEKFKVVPTPKIPDGSPIGSFECPVYEE